MRFNSDSCDITPVSTTLDLTFFVTQNSTRKRNNIMINQINLIQLNNFLHIHFPLMSVNNQILGVFLKSTLRGYGFGEDKGCRVAKVVDYWSQG